LRFLGASLNDAEERNRRSHCQLVEDDVRRVGGDRDEIHASGRQPAQRRQQVLDERELLKDSLEVYPIKDYGAIETGSHRLCHVENGHDECGQFKFVLVWRQKDGRWQVARALSYDHKL
jgi:hypothetical protein